MTTLYDYRTGENLGMPTAEQEGEVDGSPFLILWSPGSILHGRVLGNESVPVGYDGSRQVIKFDRDAYLAAFNGRPVWHTVSV